MEYKVQYASVLIYKISYFIKYSLNVEAAMKVSTRCLAYLDCPKILRLRTPPPDLVIIKAKVSVDEISTDTQWAVCRGSGVSPGFPNKILFVFLSLGKYL
jgi:hypothetical protein